MDVHHYCSACERSSHSPRHVANGYCDSCQHSCGALGCGIRVERYAGFDPRDLDDFPSGAADYQHKE